MFFFDEQLNRRDVRDIAIISVGRVSAAKTDHLEHDITFKDGKRITVLGLVVSEIMNCPAHVLPAEKGLMAIVGVDEDGSDFLSPVLGWAVTLDGAVRPVLQSGINDASDGELPIVQPDGSVRWLGFNRYESIAAFNEAHVRGVDPDREAQ